MSRPAQRLLLSLQVLSWAVRASAVSSSGSLSVHLEGPEHGPLTLSRDAWERLSGESPRVAVPRKARIEVIGPKEPRPTLTLYRQDDSDFRRAALRLDLPPETGAALRAKVSLEGKPKAGVRCQILAIDAAPVGPAGEPEIRSRSGAKGWRGHSGGGAGPPPRRAPSAGRH